jgi:hypothetical protein
MKRESTVIAPKCIANEFQAKKPRFISIGKPEALQNTRIRKNTKEHIGFLVLITLMPESSARFNILIPMLKIKKSIQVFFFLHASSCSTGSPLHVF